MACASALGCASKPATISLPSSQLMAADSGARPDDDEDAGPRSRSELGPQAHPEYFDHDSDGLSDAYELAHHSDPNLSDTDGDGVDDLVESIAGSAADDASSNPHAQGNFYFSSPFRAPPQPAQARLQFSTALQSADLFLLVDTTGSMQPALSVLREKLRTVVLPGALRAIGDLHVGVASFQDLPVSPYGDPGDVPFAVVQRPTADDQEAQQGVNALRLGSGGDGPEAAVVALDLLASGNTLPGFITASPSCPQGGRGWGCFRAGAVPIVLLISDAEFHNGPAGEHAYANLDPAPPVYATALASLRALHAHVISIRVATEGGGMGEGASDQMKALSRDTGAVGADGQPLFFSVDSAATGLDARVVDAVAAVADQIPIGVSARLRDDPSDDFDATQLVERVTAHLAVAGEEPCVSGLTLSSGAFTSVKPGSTVCFDLIARSNSTIPAAPKPAVYRAFVDVLGDGISTLDTRTVYFLVPPSVPVLL